MSAIRPLTCDNVSGAARSGNSERRLSPLLDASERRPAMQATRVCSVDGCEKPVIARGWCTKHWTRWRRHGDPLGGGVERSPLPDQCTLSGCSNPAFARELCATHWRKSKREEDPEWQQRRLATRRDWHAKNPDRVADVRRRSRERHLETHLARVAQWRSENRDQVLLNNWLHRRRRAGLSQDAIDVVDPAVVFERDGGVCQLCHEPVDPDLEFPDPLSATVDHVVPVCEPESEHSYANVVLAHWDCNRRKNRRTGAA